MPKRTRQLKPLSSEHEQALLLAFQLKKGLAGHSESAGAPKDLPGLLAIARRYEDQVFGTHTRAEEDLLGSFLPGADMRRLVAEHAEMRHFLDAARSAKPPEMRTALARFADLVERHVRWEERELFPALEAVISLDALAGLGHELERRLVIAQSELKHPQKRA
ncbi:MAG: hemerythrin domain-containing protein [Anaeromyxobacteraceae bacterium]